MSLKRKLIYLPKIHIFDFFQKQQYDNMIVPIFKGIPDDVKLIDVSYDFVRDCFCFKIEHDSFESIQEGQLYPEIEIEYQVVSYKEQKEQKDIY